MYIIVYHDDADENEDAVSAPVVFGHKEALFGEWGQSCTSSAALDCILLHYYCNIALLLYYCTIILRYYCTIVLLYYCNIAILYFCTILLVYYCTIALY